MPSAEVMKRLNAYGLNVKASASAVDEDEAERALTGKAPKQESNGQPASSAKPQRPAQQTGMGFDRPATDSARQRLEERQKAQQAARAKAKQDQQPASGRRRRSRKDGDGRAASERRQRPTRSSLQGERAPGSAGGVRRVVIDSQAARRGPGGPGGGPGMPPRRPPRRGGRRRRGAYVEPAAQDVASLKADVIKINSGSTVKDVGEYLGVPIPEIIKKLMSLGEMAMVTQTLADDTIQILADEFDKEIEIVHAADEAADDDRVRGHRRGARAARPRRDDHGPRRPRQDLAARRHPRDRGGGRRGGRHHPAHRRLPGPPRREDHHLPRHPGPRGVHRHARPRRPVDRHRGDRGGGRRRREAADPRGGRPRQGRRGPDPRRRQQDRQGGRAARARPPGDDPARPAARGVGRRDDVRRRLRQDARQPRGAARGRSS